MRIVSKYCIAWLHLITKFNSILKKGNEKPLTIASITSEKFMETQEIGTSAEEFSILIEDLSDQFQIIYHQTLCRSEC